MLVVPSTVPDLKDSKSLCVVLVEGQTHCTETGHKTDTELGLGVSPEPTGSPHLAPAWKMQEALTLPEAV